MIFLPMKMAIHDFIANGATTLQKNSLYERKGKK
jgi:hypothetical protein